MLVTVSGQDIIIRLVITLAVFEIIELLLTL